MHVHEPIREQQQSSLDTHSLCIKLLVSSALRRCLNQNICIITLSQKKSYYYLFWGQSYGGKAYLKGGSCHLVPLMQPSPCQIVLITGWSWAICASPQWILDNGRGNLKYDYYTHWPSGDLYSPGAKGQGFKPHPWSLFVYMPAPCYFA